MESGELCWVRQFRLAGRPSRGRGYDAKLPDELDPGEAFDAMLMAHVIEHFPPEELLGWMDGWLDRLRPGGHLIVASPLAWSDFHADFDHVKPYPPEAIAQLFCRADSQVQYQPGNRLELIEFGLRRDRRRRTRTEQLYSEQSCAGGWCRAGCFAIDAAYWTLFRLSGGVLAGRSTGWVGLFQKAPSPR